MGKIVRKYRFIDAWGIGENESWFSDMSEKGLHLKTLGLMFASFERGEPKMFRYRIDFFMQEHLSSLFPAMPNTILILLDCQKN